jgi:hypothetical protein
VTHWIDPTDEAEQQPAAPAVPWVDMTDELEGQSFTWVGTQQKGGSQLNEDADDN